MQEGWSIVGLQEGEGNAMFRFGRIGMVGALLAAGCQQKAAVPVGPLPEATSTAATSGATVTASDTRAAGSVSSTSPTPTGSGTPTSPGQLADERAFWRFAPEHGGGYFKRLDGGKWEEIGRDGQRMGVWEEIARTSEHVELYDAKRNYKTRLGAGKAWIARGRDSTTFGRSPHGNWENQAAKIGGIASESKEGVTLRPKEHDEMEPVRAFLQTYVLTPEIDRSGFVVDRKEYEPPRLGHYYDIVALQRNQIVKVVSLETGPKANYLTAKVSTSYSGGITTDIYVLKVGTKYKLDWASTVGYNPDDSLVSFAHGTEKSITVRLKATLSAFYNYQYENARDTHYSVFLEDSSVNDAGQFYGYVRKDSELGKRLFSILKEDRGHKLILTLRKSGERKNYLEITELVSATWVP